MRLWREARLEVKMVKDFMAGALLGVELQKSECRCGAKHIFESEC